MKQKYVCQQCGRRVRETVHFADSYHVDFYASCRLVSKPLKYFKGNFTELYNIVCINCYNKKEKNNDKEKRTYFN